MAPRQLLCRFFRLATPPSDPPFAHRRLFHAHLFPLHHLNDLSLFQVGRRFYSAASRHGSGKGFSEKVSSTPQKQSSGKVGPQAPKPVTVAPQVVQDQKAKESATVTPSRGPYFMIVAALSAAAIAVLTLYPTATDLRKIVNGSQKDEHTLEEKTITDEEEHDIHKRTDYEDTGSVEHGKVVTKEVSTPEDHQVLSIDLKDETVENEITHTTNEGEQKAPISSESLVGQQNISDDVKSSEKPHKLHEDDVAEAPRFPSTEPDLEWKELTTQESTLNTTSDDQVHNHAKDVSDALSESGMPENKEQQELIDEFQEIRQASKNERRKPNIFEAYYLHHHDGDNDVKDAHAMEKNVNLGTEDESKPETSVDTSSKKDIRDGLYHESVKNVFELLEVVHAAEKRQAEIDAHLYEEALKKLKQSFQQDLKDAQARELMYAEEANRLGKEIEVEKERGLSALRLEQKNASERLHQELKRKEEETNVKLRKAHLLAKAEISAAVAQEKASYLKDVKDVKQELEALHIAFSTRSEEIRQSHTAHKLAVGTFALEDAVKQGAPLEKEINLLVTAYGGHGSDPLLDTALSSVPKDILKQGTKTCSQLHKKFEDIKSSILELSLLPASGGGVLSHAAAKAVSMLKIQEGGQYSDGIDSVIGQVQRFLADGKLVDAADLLETSVKGTEAEVLVADWIKQARDRAVVEQVLMLVQAHVTVIASSLA